MNSTSPTTVLVGIFAILIGLGTAYGVRQAMKPKETPVAESPKMVVKQKPIPMRTIVLAKANLAPNTTLTSENLSVVRIPEPRFHEIQKNAGSMNALPFGNIDEVLNRVTSTRVMAGNWITENNLYEFGKVPMIEEKLGPDELAMTIPVNKFSSVAGMLHPNSRVNIAWTPSKNIHPDVSTSTVVTICKNVRVLTTSAEMTETNPGKVKNITNLTLAVNQKLANKLSILQSKGKFTITMAGQQDNPEMEEDCTREREDLLGILGLTVPEKSYPMNASADRWNGTSKREIKFSSDEVLEAHNETRVVMLKLKPLKKAPKATEDPDTVVVE